MGGLVMYVFQTNQIEATMSNQANYFLQQYLMSAKLASASFLLYCFTLENFTMMQHFFFEKGVFEYGFLLWKYKQKSLKAVRYHLEVELLISQRFLHGEVTLLLTVWITDNSPVSPLSH